MELALSSYDRAAEAFSSDILDATKIVPEELAQSGRTFCTESDPDNFFADRTSSFCAHVLPGIDFSTTLCGGHPLLRGYANFRLGGPTLRVPINAPIAAVTQINAIGMHRKRFTAACRYEPNSLGGGCPFRRVQWIRLLAETLENRREQLRGKPDALPSTMLQRDSFSIADATERAHISKAFRFDCRGGNTLAVGNEWSPALMMSTKNSPNGSRDARSTRCGPMPKVLETDINA